MIRTTAAASWRPPSSHYFLQDLPANALVGERSVAPPPAVLLHLPGGGDKVLRHVSKVGIGVVQAEDQTTGPDPAQCELFRPQIILKHPVVARRLGIMNHPDRREVTDPDGKIGRGQHVVQAPGPLI